MRAASVCAIFALGLCARAATAGAAESSADADAGIEVVGGTDARKVQLQVCPRGLGDSEPAHTCTRTEGRPYRGGKLTVLIRNGNEKAKVLEILYLPNGGTEPATLPGDSNRIFLVEDGTSSSSFFGSLVKRVSGRLAGNLLRKVKQSLPELAELAVGRLRVAKRLARSPATAKLVAHALRIGARELGSAAIDELASKLEGVISPSGRDVRMDGSEVRDLLTELGKALIPPGAKVASVALRGVFEAAAETVAESPLTVAGRKSRSVSIGFALPLTESAAAIDGKLVISTGDEKPLAVQVSGEARSFGGVTVTPSTLPVDADDDGAELTLEGPELVEYLRSHGGEELSATLYGAGNDTAEATLTLPTADEVEGPDTSGGGELASNANRATAGVAVDDSDASAGKYTGKIALPELPAETGAVTVELHSHDGFPLMVFLVFAGIFVTGVGTRIATMATRRKRLTEVLTQTYNVFVDVLKGPGEIASWHLDDLLAEDPKAPGEPRPRAGRLQGLPALKRSIATARSSADLDEDAERVLDMIARMQRWLRLEPLARRLELVAQRRGKDGPLAWEDSNTLRDTRALLELARREPADAEKADDLVARLMFQVEWHSGMAAAWQLSSLSTRVKELDDALKDSHAGERKPGELDTLSARLRALLAGVDVPRPGPIPGEPDEDLDNGMTPVKWEASSNLFTGWATLDAQSYGQVARRVATSSRAQYVPSWTAIRHELRFSRADWVWTGTILVFTSAAYSATVYSDTWGGCGDFATAFLAGSLGKVTIDWAALPIFQSVRLRKAKEG
jgi:hypothetical protein